VNRIRLNVRTALLGALLILPLFAFGEEPPVKKSKSGICHPIGGRYYSRTKTFSPYESMEACIKSGGRYPKK